MEVRVCEACGQRGSKASPKCSISGSIIDWVSLPDLGEHHFALSKDLCVLSVSFAPHIGVELTISLSIRLSNHKRVQLVLAVKKTPSECLHLTAGVFEFGFTVLKCASRNPKISLKISVDILKREKQFELRGTLAICGCDWAQ